jgi:hypothetical protein
MSFKTISPHDLSGNMPRRFTRGYSIGRFAHPSVYHAQDDGSDDVADHEADDAARQVVGHCAGRRSSGRRSRGMMYVELLVAVGMFMVLILAITQLRISQLRAERHLEVGARRLERAHNLLECAMTTPWESLRETPSDQLLTEWMARLAVAPGFVEFDESWRLSLEELEDPLPGLRIIVEHLRHSPDSPDRHPIRLVAWRYDISGAGESLPSPDTSADSSEETES